MHQRRPGGLVLDGEMSKLPALGVALPELDASERPLPALGAAGH